MVSLGERFYRELREQADGCSACAHRCFVTHAAACFEFRRAGSGEQGIGVEPDEGCLSGAEVDAGGADAINEPGDHVAQGGVVPDDDKRGTVPGAALRERSLGGLEGVGDGVFAGEQAIELWLDLDCAADQAGGGPGSGSGAGEDEVGAGVLGGEDAAEPGGLTTTQGIKRAVAVLAAGAVRFGSAVTDNPEVRPFAALHPTIMTTEAKECKKVSLFGFSQGLVADAGMGCLGVGRPFQRGTTGCLGLIRAHQRA